MDDDDPIDTMPKIEEECRPPCSKKWVDYEACIARVKNDKTGEAHCTGQVRLGRTWSCPDSLTAIGGLTSRSLVSFLARNAPQYLDFYACLQHCAVPRVFKTLK
jgi:ubiquinol-cytochrome c reductase subunit 6